MPRYKCPHCEEIIDYVHFSASTSGYESGSANIDSEGHFCNFETDDSSTDDSFDYEYRCPECDEELDDSDLEPIGDDEEDEEDEDLNEDGAKSPKQEDKDLKELLSGHNFNIRSMGDYEERFIECKKCGQTNCVNENELKYESAECVYCGSQLVKGKYKELVEA